MKKQTCNLTTKAPSCLFFFFCYKNIFSTVDIFSLNNLLFLSANLEMWFGLIVFLLVSALLVVQKVFPHLTTNEGFRTLHKSVQHLLYTLNSPAQGMVFPFTLFSSVPQSLSEYKTERDGSNHLWVVLFLGRGIRWTKSGQLANPRAERGRNGQKRHGFLELLFRWKQSLSL